MFVTLLALAVWSLVAVIAGLMIAAALNWCDRPERRPHPMPSGSLPRKRAF